MLRTTKQRVAIRAVFEQAGRPLGPSEVLESVTRELEGVGLATVYRAIKSMMDEGALVSVDLPGEPARYEMAGKRHHHHFHCRSCGGVYDLPGCPANIRQLIPRGFRLTGHEVLLYGECASCANYPRASAARTGL